MKESSNLIALILCGGLSSRMGQDKGLLLRGKMHWVEVLIHLIRTVNPSIDIVLSINQNQIEEYTQFTNEQIQLVVDNHPIKGPLGGILSVFNTYNSHHFLVVPCDMISLKQEVLRMLFKTAETENAEAFAFSNDTNFQPMPCIISNELITKIDSMATENALEKYSLKYIFSLSNSQFIPLEERFQSCFKNFNSPADLDG